MPVNIKISMFHPLANTDILRYIIKILVVFVLTISVGSSSAQVLLDNKGLDLKITNGTVITVNGSVLNEDSGQFINHGVLYIRNNISHTGSLEMFTPDTGLVILDGNGLQSVDGTSPITFWKIEINNSSIGISLNNNIIVKNSLLMMSGDVDLNGHDIDLQSTGILLGETNDHRVKGFPGYIKTTRVISAPYELNVAGLGFMITSSENFGLTTIERGHEPQNMESNIGIARYYNINPENNTSLNTTVEFHYLDDNELNGLPEPALWMFESVDYGTTWENRNGSIITDDDYFFKETVQSFQSRWTLGDESWGLPITLLSFTAELNDYNETELEWTTVVEINSDYFTVERSANGMTYEAIGQVNAAGNSVTQLDYDFQDPNPFEGATYYRLNMVDLDGTFKYSNIEEVHLGSEGNFTFYPNPIMTTGTLTINTTNELSEMIIYSNSGQIVQYIHFDASGFSGYYSVPLESIPSGLYVFVVKDEFGYAEKGQLVVVDK